MVVKKVPLEVLVGQAVVVEELALMAVVLELLDKVMMEVTVLVIQLLDSVLEVEEGLVQ